MKRSKRARQAPTDKKKRGVTNVRTEWKRYHEEKTLARKTRNTMLYQSRTLYKKTKEYNRGRVEWHPILKI